LIDVPARILINQAENSIENITWNEFSRSTLIRRRYFANTNNLRARLSILIQIRKKLNVFYPGPAPGTSPGSGL